MSAEAAPAAAAAAESKEEKISSTEEESILFTSESVNEGHPDKICDQISDAILDACLKGDPASKVACETLVTTGLVVVAGEITTKAVVNYETIVRQTLSQIGYDDKAKGMDYRTVSVLVAVGTQSPDIAGGVHIDRKTEDIGAGDQGHMFGYASNETPELMPLTHVLATSLGRRLTEVRLQGILPWVRPDGKTQVVIEYIKKGGFLTPKRVHTIVISTQHDPGVEIEAIRSELKKHVVDAVVPAELLDDDTVYHLNPSGRFVIGGPHGDAGLTGRKIIIDTYGGWGAHGGGAFSGKDPTKVDRSGAYAARWIAKSIVKAGFAARCLVQVSYAIGVAEPLSLFVDTYGTNSIPESRIVEIVKKNFDLRPGKLMEALDLCKPRYQPTACYGHFGRDDLDLPWEKTKALVDDKADAATASE